MKAYSLDLRQKIVEAYDAGGISQRQLAERFRVSLAFITKLFKQRRDENSIAPRLRQQQTPTKLSPENLLVLQSIVEANNDATLDELKDLLYAQTSVSIGRSTLDRMLTKLEITRKKKPYTPQKKAVNESKRLGLNTGS
jgi:transposase